MGNHYRLRRLVAPLLLLLGACAGLPPGDFDRPEIELIGLRPLSGRGMEARFLVTLRIVNPNATALAVEGMAYEIELRDTRVLSGVSSQRLEVDAFSETAAEVEVAAGLLGSLALLRDLLGNPPQEAIPYALRAKLSLGGLRGTLRVSREGEIRLGRSAAARAWPAAA